MASDGGQWIISQIAFKRYGLSRAALYLAGLRGEIRSEIVEGCPPRWWSTDVAEFAARRDTRKTAS